LRAVQILHGDGLADAEGLAQEQGQDDAEDDDAQAAKLNESKDDRLAQKGIITAGVLMASPSRTSVGGGEEGIDEAELSQAWALGASRGRLRNDQDDEHAGQGAYGIAAGGAADEVSQSLSII
jgi:hypothetical protein